MSDDDMGVDYPDFVQIKGSPSSSPKSIPSRENSVILEAREVAQQHKIGKNKQTHWTVQTDVDNDDQILTE